MKYAFRSQLARILLPAALLVSACGSTEPEPPKSPESNGPSTDAPALVRASTHPTAKAGLGKPVSLAEMEALLDEPGPLSVETVTSGKWTVARSGLINLKHKRAKALEDGPEPVEDYFHAITHPSRGLYLVDTGVETALREAKHPLRSSELGKSFGFDKLEVLEPLGEWLQGKQVEGVFLTHLHLDHVLGLPDLATSVPIYSGIGETKSEAAFHAYSQSTVDVLLEQRPPIAELALKAQPVLDIFGDGSFFAIAAPGHTPGSVAYVARSTEGAVLLTGDVCHTAWGWNNDVEPGDFTLDHSANAESLALLRKLAARHPGMKVRLGHQPL